MDRFDEWAKELIANAGPCEIAHRYDTDEGGMDLPRSMTCDECVSKAVAAALRSASHRQETEGECPKCGGDRRIVYRKCQNDAGNGYVIGICRLECPDEEHFDRVCQVCHYADVQQIAARGKGGS